MNSRVFAFQLPRLRGLPGVLALGLGVIAVLGVLVLILAVGAAVVVTGLVVSACAALYFTLRQKLAGTFSKERRFETTTSTSVIEAREIEVEVLPAAKK
jgi:hypothetical protein